MSNNYGFIYQTTCDITGKRYIGRRVREFTDYDDLYLGSGKELNKDIDKYGREHFHRIILRECSSKEELVEAEKFYLESVDAMHNPEYYNLTNNSIGWPTERGKPLPQYWRDHMSESQKKRPPISEETREKLRIANTGKHHSEDTRKKIGDRQRGKRLSSVHRSRISEALKGERNPNYGKHYTSEASKKQSEAQKKRFSINPIYNKGIPMEEEQKQKVSASVTELWKNEEYRKKQSESHSGKVWMHKQESLEKIYILESQIIEYENLGWKRGRGKSCKRIM